MTDELLFGHVFSVSFKIDCYGDEQGVDVREIHNDTKRAAFSFAYLTCGKSYFIEISAQCLGILFFGAF